MTGVGYEAAKRGEKTGKQNPKVKCKNITWNKIRRIENTQAVEGTAAEFKPMQKATAIIK